MSEGIHDDRPKILLVDDSQKRTLGNSWQILSKAFQVKSVAGVVEAREKIDEERFDLVICAGNLDTSKAGARLAEQIVLRNGRAIIISADESTRKDFIPFVHLENWNKDSMIGIVQTELERNRRGT
jgi:DNA-binding NtrC family response regulator